MSTSVVIRGGRRYSDPYDIGFDYARGAEVSVTEQRRGGAVDTGASLGRDGLGIDSGR